ncbi:MAG: YggS family pyridoxal phosphate-dependent enzyme [Ignavibacteriales bacterium]|nr:YggS family pyridoxal phosphate-dependent enzyme [Ignavibacteriales bacterium]
MVAENIKNIRKRIEETCFRCGRRPDDVQIVAVTKTFDVERIKEALNAGHRDFGENYAQELARKKEELGDSSVRWHFIGHLQTNKVKYIADFVHLIHTVDNERVVGELQKRGEKLNRSFDVLVEVHTTAEATKSGVAPAHVLALVKSISKLPRVCVGGLMTMGPFSDDPNDSRPSFRQLADLKKTIEHEGIENVSMKHLSMGMSHDFEVGIEEGATIVRIGTAIFGKREL